MNSLTIGKLAEWVYEHKKVGAFHDCSLEDIISCLQEDVNNNRMMYVFDDQDCKFIGVICFDADYEEHSIFVRNIVVTKHSALVSFVQFFNQNFPGGWSISGNRDNETIHYNTSRLAHLLLIMKGKH